MKGSKKSVAIALAIGVINVFVFSQLPLITYSYGALMVTRIWNNYGKYIVDPLIFAFVPILATFVVNIFLLHKATGLCNRKHVNFICVLSLAAWVVSAGLVTLITILTNNLYKFDNLSGAFIGASAVVNFLNLAVANIIICCYEKQNLK